MWKNSCEVLTYFYYADQQQAASHFGILINKAVKMSISQARSHARQMMFLMRRISLFFKFLNLLSERFCTVFKAK